MANVRTVFPALEKMKRVRRGQPPEIGWTKAPGFDQVAAKLAPVLVDTNVRTSTNTHGATTEMRRYILRSGNKFGYLCFNSANVGLAGCRSYDDFQRQYNSLEQAVHWTTGLPALVEYIRAHCTSSSYITRASTLRV